MPQNHQGLAETQITCLLQPYLDSGNPGGAGDLAFLVSSHAGVAIQGPHLEHHLLEIIKRAFEKKPGFEGSLPCSGAF